MEVASCSSNIYALPHGQMSISASTRTRCAGLATPAFRSHFWRFNETSLSSGIGPRSCQKKKMKRPCWRNLNANGQDSQRETTAKPELAILLEVEGVLADVNRFGNRNAFNVAFQKLGLDCANWTDPVYMDLVRRGGGDEKRMLVLFFERIGWPTSLPTDEKEPFLKNVMQEKHHALQDYVTTGSLSLRTGIDKFMDDALEAGIPIIILASYSRNGEDVARCIAEMLGSERTQKIKIVGQAEVENSFYGQLVLGKGASAGLDELLSNEAAKAVAAEKQRVAKEVASMLKLSVEVDTNSSKMSKEVIASLRAGAEYAGMPVQSCILLAGSQTGVLAAERIGMPCIVMRSSSTSRAEFPSARAVVEGFGAGDLTISRLLRMQSS